jgi:hypothetical protein
MIGWKMLLFKRLVMGETLFWHYNWCVGGPFVETFPRLFSISLQSNANIKDMGVWIWQLKWRRPFFVWEEEIYREFLLLLDLVPISRDKHSWNYRHDIGGLFR